MRTNTMHTMIRGLGAAALALALASCGSGLNSTAGGGSGGAINGNSLVEMGNGNGSSFKNQVLDIQVTNLAAGGTTGVTANLVDANSANALYTQSVTVNFSSVCVSAGTASFSSASVTTATGAASTSYTAAGCNGKDTITATATVGSSTLTATGSLTVQSAALGSLIFDNATPTEIGLAGMGGVTSSKVTFQLLDSNGNPVPNITMSFTLDINSGDATVSQPSAVTGSDGRAFTFVQAGTQHTVVHVTASATNNGVTVTGGSSGIVVSTGVPTQRNFTLVMSAHNVEAVNTQLGTSTAATSSITVGLADRFQNPVPGQQVSFTTNGGNIQPSCATAASGGSATCTVTWTAASPVPDPVVNALDTLDHAHILAYTTGEEHFTDANGDGVFNNGDTFTPFAGNVNATDNFLGINAPPQDDVGDPYLDTNESGTYNHNEFFAPSGNANNRRDPDGSWHGIGCGGINSNAANVTAKDENGTNQTVQCGSNTIIIGKEDCLVMTTSSLFVLDPTATNPSPSSPGAASTVTASVAGTTAIYYVVDSNGDVPPAGTTITLDATNAVGVTVTFPGSSSSITVPDLPAACSTGTNGTLPSSGASAPFKGYPISVLVTITPGGTGVSGSFNISLKTPVTLQDEAGISVPIN